MIDSRLNELIVQIYDTTLHPGQWPEVLTRFADTIDARGAIVSEIEGIGDSRQIVTPYVCTRYDPAQIQKYLKSYIHYEFLDQERYEALSRARDGIDLIDQHTLAGNDLQAFLNRPNVKRMQANGIRQRAGGLLDKDNTHRSRFSIHFGDDSQGLTDEIRAMLQVLLPHIAKAIAIGRAMRQSREVNKMMLEAMERLHMGICILDRHGRVEVANNEFLRQVEAYRAYSIDGNRRLSFDDSINHKRLTDLMADVAKNGRHGARPRKEAVIIDGAEEVAGATDIGALCIEVAPIHRVEDFGTKAFDGAVIYSLDTTQPMPFDPAMMQDRFNLSRTETALLELLAKGMSNSEIADYRSRSVDTINVQVRTLLSKTGARNRTHLVRLMACFGTDYLLPAKDDPAAPGTVG